MTATESFGTIAEPPRALISCRGLLAPGFLSPFSQSAATSVPLLCCTTLVVRKPL
jgi:hypothetical protein